MTDQNVVELGIYHGGSAALAALLGAPRRLVVVDLSDPVPALEAFIEARGLADRLRTHYGVDQADGAALRRIVGDDVAHEPLDLVIDDASHLLEPTRASFEALFPMLRPGGRYLIEDWRWELRFAAELEHIVRTDPDGARAMLRAVAEKGPTSLAATTLGRVTDPEILAVTGRWELPAEPHRPLATIVGELAAAHAVAPGLVGPVTAHGWWITVERGPDPSPDPLRFDQLLGVAGDLL